VDQLAHAQRRFERFQRAERRRHPPELLQRRDQRRRIERIRALHRGQSPRGVRRQRERIDQRGLHLRPHGHFQERVRPRARQQVGDVAEAVDVLPRVAAGLQAELESLHLLICVVERAQAYVHHRLEDLRVVLEVADVRDRDLHCCCC
jgi:hypothetical protein